ncbi:carboxypeptidase-like regulatory domain-containing protein [Rufibacter roseus]|uniref:Carboxypeptidase-like regulatory domain-containing protein n=1 Tax=Rufibacter roseus TaxID=1567108 RepID=A0ABW2DKJ1_9BACT|nr:carboxypeptidase-like regulatory domain-containing protein [Rufibacter roseus]
MPLPRRLPFQLLLLSCCLFFAFSAYGQQNLANSRTTSYFTYVYKITDAEAKTLYKKGVQATKQSYFHTAIDSFPTHQIYSKPLAQGHYLFTYASGPELVFELRSQSNLEMKLLQNQIDLAVVVHDSQGNLISDANVWVKKKRIPFDKATQTYRLAKAKKEGLLAVEHQGFTFYQPLDRNSQTPPLYRKILYYVPVYYLYKPFQDIIRSLDNHEPTGVVRTVFSLFEDDYKREGDEKYKGFLIFNKPMYQPGDTVRYKAFILKKNNNKLYKKPLVASIYTSEKTKIVGRLTPYRPGAYEGSFVLHDSLQLKLDSYVYLNLEQERKWYDLEVMDGSFRYEEYELKENNFELRLKHQEHTTGKTNQVIMQGKDANGLNLPDARVELTVLSSQVIKTDQASVFVPDTLWTHSQPLNATGETTLDLPPSIFPKASMKYQIHAAFLNSSNERSTKNVSGIYLYQKGQLQLSLLQDSLKANYLEGDSTVTKEAVLTLLNKEGQRLQEKKVTLPTKFPLHPYASIYELRSGELLTALNAADKGANINFMADRSQDSIYFSLQNPRKLPFWYFVYRKNNLIARGQDTTAQWSFTRKLQGDETYHVSLQYVWAGEVKQEEYGNPYREKELDVAVMVPPTVYPGQQTQVTVAVTDAKGKPAPKVDLTAYAITSKFKNTSPPTVPFFGYYKGRKARSKFKLDNIKTREEQKLNWEHWSREMGLDTLAYYQLLYPPTGFFTNYSPAPDSLTQFAPFVVDSGRVADVHVVYVDEVPVYFSGTDVKPAYSFPADSGYHTIKLRTDQYLITLDSVFFMAKQKLVLSVDQNKMYQWRANAEKHQLSTQERKNLSNYLLPVEQNFYGGIIYLHQGNRVQLLPARPDYYRTNTSRTQRYPTLLAGPFRPDSLYFRHLGNFTTGFVPEPNYTHRFEPCLLKMREKQTLPDHVYLSRYSKDKLTPADFTQTLLTDSTLRKLWLAQDELRWLNEVSYPTSRHTSAQGLGRLSWQLDSTFKQAPTYAFLYQPQQPTDSVKIFRGDTRSVSHLMPGTYRFLLIFPDEKQLSTQVAIQADGVLHINFSSAQLKDADVQSRALTKLVQQKILATKAMVLEAQKPKPIAPPKVTPLTSGAGLYNHTIIGTVTDAETREALPGVTVVLKGTTIGAATDLSGQYTINAPANGTLVFSYIGYMPHEVAIQGKSAIHAKLMADVMALQEVVVVGYGTVERKSLTGSITTVNLSGTVAGVAVGQPGANINIRGISSIDATKQPLLIVDGVPFSGNLDDLKPNDLASVSVLKDAAATAIYGAAGANGVIIITTQKGKEQAEQALAQTGDTDPANSIRSYFSDYAFWQPRLTTDKQGKATFPVTFPGDVTSWKANVLAMDGNKRSGQTSTEIRSFKAMMATLSGPRFLIEGDKAQIIGKAVNYFPDTAAVKTTFAFNGSTLREQQLKLDRVYADTFMIQAPAVAPDSVELMFMLRQGNGFSDGERRHIGVYKKGVVERQGQFLNLHSDTTVTLTFDPAKGPVHFYAQDNLLQVMLNEIDYLHRYEYWCNEQAASKLIGLLWEKRIRENLGQPFEHDRMVRRLIKFLEKTQKQDGTWSWWATGPAYIWISHHVTEALVMAQADGYNTSFKKPQLIEYLTYELEKKDAQDKVRALEILQQLEAKVDFPAYVSKLEKQTELTLEEQLRLTRLRQQLKLPAPLDTLQKHRQRTMQGGLFWGEEKSNLINNHISNTLLAYDILKAAGGHEQELRQILAYLLSERKTGHWRNTYESARILETLLPDVMQDNSSTPENALVLTGDLNTTLSRFPADTTFTPTQPLTLRKQGSLPLYLTAYQNEWVAQPTRVEKDFVVRTSFANFTQAKAALDAGKPVDLVVEVEVKADASFVMIEVPIPAGCTYDSKSTWGPNEAHREYFRNKVSIFSNHLSKGHYTFTIKLLPRYKGTYTLNPARAELMYFPTFFGREAAKEVEVK